MVDYQAPADSYTGVATQVAEKHGTVLGVFMKGMCMCMLVKHSCPLSQTPDTPATYFATQHDPTSVGLYACCRWGDILHRKVSELYFSDTRKEGQYSHNGPRGQVAVAR